jgi:hypothetical protein
MDKLTDTKDVKIQIPDNNIHIGNHCIDTIPSESRGFTEKLGIFRKGEIDRSGLSNQRDGWYVTAVYLANPEAFYDLLKLVHCATEEFCMKDLCEASRKVRHGGFHKLQIILLRHIEVSPSFLYAPSNGEKSWQVIQVCRLLNLVKSLGTKVREPFAIEMSGLVHYYRVRSSDIHGISYYSNFYGMLDKDTSTSENVYTETLFEICAIRDKIAYGPKVYRAIAAVYAGSRNKDVNGFDGHKHLASPFLPTVHIEVLYEPSTKFAEGGSPNSDNAILALKEAALQFNRYGKVLEPAEMYNVACNGNLDRLGIPSQQDLENFADSGVWKDDWELKTQDPNLSWPGKYPFDLEPAPAWNWGALEKEPEKEESERAEPERSERGRAEPASEDEPLSSLNVEHDSIRSVQILRPKFALPSLRLVMRKTIRNWKEATEQSKIMNTGRTPTNREHVTWSGAYWDAVDPSSSGTWKSLRKGIKGVFRRTPLPAALRQEETTASPDTDELIIQSPAVGPQSSQCQLSEPEDAGPRIVKEEATIPDVMRTSEIARENPADLYNAACAVSHGKTPDCGQWIFWVGSGNIRGTEFVPNAKLKKAKQSSLLKRATRRLNKTLRISSSGRSLDSGWER